MCRRLFMVVWIVAFAGSVEAQPQALAQAPGKAGPLSGLDAGDAQLVRSAIEKAGQLRTPQAGKALAVRIRQGLPPELLAPAVDALVSIGGPAAQQVLPELTRHTRPAVRVQAAAGLAQLKPTGAAALLKSMLKDSDETVRAAAAQGLLKLGPDSAMPELVAAACLGDGEAATAVATKARPAHAALIAARMSEPLQGAWASCLERLLVRTDWPLAARLGLADKLLGGGGPAGVALFEKVIASLKKENPERKAYVDKLVASTSPKEKKP